jgi:hypothetical protein
MPEDQRHVDVPGPQHPQRLRWLGLGEPQVHARVPGTEHGRGGGHDGAERGREGGEPQPPGAQPRVRGELVLGGVQPPDDLACPLGEQSPGVRQPDAAAGLLYQLGAGFRLKPGQVVADRRLGVVQRVRRCGDRAMPRDRDEDAQPGNVQHPSTIDGVDLSS